MKRVAKQLAVVTLNAKHTNGVQKVLPIAAQRNLVGLGKRMIALHRGRKVGNHEAAQSLHHHRQPLEETARDQSACLAMMTQSGATLTSRMILSSRTRS